MFTTLLAWSALAFLSVVSTSQLAAGGSFKIEDNRFVLDGKPIQIFSGRCASSSGEKDPCVASMLCSPLLFCSPFDHGPQAKRRLQDEPLNPAVFTTSGCIQHTGETGCSAFKPWV